MTELKQLNLNEKDFDLLVEGLDALPEKGIAGEMIGDLMGAMFMKDDEAAKAKYEADRDQKRRDKEDKQKMMKEDIKILQGKLLMLKRYLMEQGALNETYSILDHVK